MNRARTFGTALLLSFGLTLGLCLVPDEARAEEPSAVVVDAATPAATETSHVTDELAELAAREAAASPELEQFAGGDAVYVSSGAVVLVLVIVIIVLVL
jgi:hypothetical protein